MRGDNTVIEYNFLRLKSFFFLIVLRKYKETKIKSEKLIQTDLNSIFKVQRQSRDKNVKEHT